MVDDRSQLALFSCRGLGCRSRGQDRQQDRLDVEQGKGDRAHHGEGDRKLRSQSFHPPIQIGVDSGVTRCSARDSRSRNCPLSDHMQGASGMKSDISVGYKAESVNAASVRRTMDLNDRPAIESLD